MKALMMLVGMMIATTPALAGTGTHSPGGRFQLVQLGNMARDQFLLDTDTGRIWRATCMKGSPSDCEFIAWIAEDVDGINGMTHQKIINKSLQDQIEEELAKHQKQKEQAK